ncbi:helix-turn-helix transcriptional regulator [Rhodococcoides kyotonense]|uniref:AraC-type DNA-binding protein n=1 Tax=Rhodococcoides kyotonense TaxID=398843 RepID=A0A239FCM2_9NOCA|nr:helix-turn-helix transcriptional regulator [Rhodococcus kyotonensis]SNS54577.1 AraC-type DNA-binding protein [Rhodococcus kyotonensis]
MKDRGREDLDFRSADLGESEEFLSATYARMRISSDSLHSRTGVSRRWLGRLNFDDLDVDYEMDYDADPLHRFCLVRVQQGYMEEDYIGEPSDMFFPGDVTLLSPPDLPYSGRTRGRYDLSMFDTTLLDTVASCPLSNRRCGVNLTGHRPVSDAAERGLGVLIDYVRRDVLESPTARSSPLVVSTVSAHLAATVLATFPNDAVTDPTAGDRNSATSALLRRAADYIEEHVDTEITLADIAETVCLTPRAVQYMFRRHWDCTPMEYVRRVRLDHAHRDLSIAEPTSNTTVSSIAHRWGFVHSGRFAAFYRQTYGHDPSQTLHE